MPVCPYCQAPAPEGALFCAQCGRTVVPATPAPTATLGAFAASSPSAGSFSAAPPLPPPAPSTAPPEWIPPELVGKAIHCPRCNTLISPVAVVCPVCQAPLPPSAEGGAGAVPPG